MTRPLTAARATGLAREALNGAVLFTTQTGNDCLLTRVRSGATTSAEELRVLNTAAAYFRRFGYEATVVTSGGTRGAAVRRMVKVVDLAARAARIEEATQRRHEVMARELSGYPKRPNFSVTPEQEAAAQRFVDGAECPTCSATAPGEPCFGCGTVAPTGPSPEVVKAAVTRFQAELDANADTIGAVLSQPLPGESAGAQCPACRYYSGHTSWCPMRPLRGEDRPEPGPVSIAASINPREWSVRRDGELLGTVRRERGMEERWEASDAHGIRRINTAATREEAARKLVDGIDRRAADDAERNRLDAEQSQRWTPRHVLPSGRYGVIATVGRSYTGPEPVVTVVQIIQRAGQSDRWAPTGGTWHAGIIAAHTGRTLAIDHGAGWVLPEEDTAELVAYAASVARGAVATS